MQQKIECLLSTYCTINCQNGSPVTSQNSCKLTLNVFVVNVGRGSEIVLVGPEPSALPEVSHPLPVDGRIELVVQDVVGQGVTRVQRLKE